jgi:hypothetical protein
VRFVFAFVLAILLLGNTSAVAAKKPNLLDSLVIPAAPTVNWAHNVAPPGPAENSVGGSAAYDWGSDTVYFQGNMPKFTRAHELGHALDDQELNDGDRHFFTRLMGMSGDWNQGTGFQGGTHSPSEIFADWYGNAAVGNDPSRAWSDAYATPPDPKTFRRFAQALDRLGHRRGLLGYS